MAVDGLLTGDTAYGRCYKLTFKDPFNPGLAQENAGTQTSSSRTWSAYSAASGKYSEGSSLILEQRLSNVGLNITFTITKRIKKEDKIKPNSMTLTIENLSEENFASINTGDMVNLECGYRDKMGQIFTGRVQSAIRKVTRTGSKTKIIATETYIQNLAAWKVKKFTARKGQPWQKVVATLCESIVEVIPQINDFDVTTVPMTPLPRDYIFWGDPWQVIFELLRPFNMVYYTNNGKIFVAKSEGNAVYTHVILDSYNGLLNQPSRKIEKLKASDNKKKKKKDVRYGWMVESIINPNIQLGSRISVPSYVRSGAAATPAPGESISKNSPKPAKKDSKWLVDKNLVEGIVYNGNSRTGNWKMSLLLYDVPVPGLSDNRSTPEWHEQYKNPTKGS